MPVSKAQQRAVAKYESKAYDKTLIRLPKGQLDTIKAAAVAAGESVNSYVHTAIIQRMERDKATPGGIAQQGVGSVEVSE